MVDWQQYNEAVSYFYKVPNSLAPQVVSPDNWQVAGPFPDGQDLDLFQHPPEAMFQQLSQGPWSETFSFDTTEYRVLNLKGKYGWLRLGNAYQRRPAYPLTDHSIYVRTTLTSDTDRHATLRLGLDNWAIVYLHSEQVAMLNHAEEFETARIPIRLRKGNNQLLIKTNNRTNHNMLVWAIHCVVE